MFAAWRRLSNDQRLAWSLVSGAIVAGSVIKVAYFKFSRSIIVNDAERRHQESLGHLHEAKQFAVWSEQDRTQRLPKLTDTQREQMRQYLELVQQQQHDLVASSEQQGRHSNDSGNSNDIMDHASHNRRSDEGLRLHRERQRILGVPEQPAPTRKQQ